MNETQHNLENENTQLSIENHYSLTRRAPLPIFTSFNNNPYEEPRYLSTVEKYTRSNTPLPTQNETNSSLEDFGDAPGPSNDVPASDQEETQQQPVAEASLPAEAIVAPPVISKATDLSSIESSQQQDQSEPTLNEGVSYKNNFKAAYDNYLKGNTEPWPNTEENTLFYNLWKELFNDLFSLYEINIEENAKRAYINYLVENVDNPRYFLYEIWDKPEVIQSRINGGA